jgi:hypothetical protein
MRGVDVQRADVDSPWLFEGDNILRVNEETTLSCLHVFNEEWEPNRYAVRDLDTIEATAAPDQ